MTQQPPSSTRTDTLVPDTPLFRSDSAGDEASKRLIDIAFDRAVNGTDWIELDGDGQVVRTRRRHNDRLLMFLLRAHYPLCYERVDRYRGMDDDPPSALPLLAVLDRQGAHHSALQ